ncbi:LacI family transcriptional regulator [Hydrogenovibrio sp. SC-1]|uniref:substrate-binding domain-containing protein n=1 Tax=Hydrogenovibrio sp. SC-1 TaxID=2065820 RepID=UPI000C7AC384|nr:substrate-binding domain-containing protein [Hydrogenovibrio sp. SC-1]PLA74625.1 LacI family transcriptional regulator [Hydrogenovibrio sp. SC-1]
MIKQYRTLLWLIFILPNVALADTPKTIAFAQDDMANDFRKAQVNEVKAAVAKHHNLRFIASNAKGKTALLIYQIDRFIQQQVDLIIVGTNDAKAVVPVVTKAYQSGIPVIILDRGIESENYTSFINSDNVKIGQLGAEYIAKKLNYQGQVLLMEGLQTADVTHLRSEGFLKEMAKYPKIKVIKRTGNYLRRDAIIAMEGVLKDGIKVDAVFSESDSMLSGVRSALQRFDKDPSNLITVGCDYTSEAQTAIRNDTQTASVLFPLGGDKSVEFALKILAGESVPKHYFIPVKIVDKTNVNSVKPIF